MGDVGEHLDGIRVNIPKVYWLLVELPRDFFLAPAIQRCHCACQRTTPRYAGTHDSNLDRRPSRTFNVSMRDFLGLHPFKGSFANRSRHLAHMGGARGPRAPPLVAAGGPSMPRRLHG